MEIPANKNEEFFREFPCPIETVFQVVGGKWRTQIIWAIGTSEQPIRFNELQQSLSGISKKVLSHHLRELEARNLIARQEFIGFPPKVEYKLTEFGETLKPVFAASVSWVEENQQPIREIIKSQHQAKQ